MAFLRLSLTTLLVAALSVRGQITTDFQSQFGVEVSDLETIDFAVSPAAVSVDLGLLYFGAKDATSAEFRRFLQLPDDEAVIESLYSKVSGDLEQQNSHNYVQFNYNSKVFGLDKAYQDKVQKIFGNDVFANHEANTPDSPVVTSMTIFQGQFDNQHFQDMDYFWFVDQTIYASLKATLQLKDWTKKADILVFSLHGGLYKYVVIKPEEDNPADLSNYFNFLNYDATLNGTQPTVFDYISFEGISAASSIYVTNPLINLGAFNSFSENADFQGAGSFVGENKGKPSFYINQVRQQAVFQITECGPSGFITTDIYTSSEKKENTIGHSRNDDANADRQFQAGNNEHDYWYNLQAPYVYAVITSDNNNVLISGKVLESKNPPPKAPQGENGRH